MRKAAKNLGGRPRSYPAGPALPATISFDPAVLDAIQDKRLLPKAHSLSEKVNILLRRGLARTPLSTAAI